MGIYNWRLRDVEHYTALGKAQYSNFIVVIEVHNQVLTGLHWAILECEECEGDIRSDT